MEGGLGLMCPQPGQNSALESWFKLTAVFGEFKKKGKLFLMTSTRAASSMLSPLCTLSGLVLS